MVNNEGLILHNTKHKKGRIHDYDIIYKHLGGGSFSERIEYIYQGVYQTRSYYIHGMSIHVL